MIICSVFECVPGCGIYFSVYYLNVVGIEAVGPVPKPDMEMGHQRSESSSDSFVCVSESATNEGDRGMSQEPTEPDSWEMVGRDSRESPGSPKSLASQNKNKEEFDIEDLLGEDTPAVIAADGGQENQKDQDIAEDSNSDWENWDDW